ncbi:MAG: HNH endonuclease [bacterium]
MKPDPHCNNGHHKVLVLNANFKPINICSWKRALCMVYLGKAINVEESKEKINSSYILPFIIKLTHYVPFSHSGVIFSRKNIYLRDNHTCQYCGSKKNLTIDHIIPKSKGGTDSWENIIVCCIKCNNKKGDQLPEKSGLKLKRVPYRPPSNLYLHMTRLRNVPKCWHDYFFRNKKQ